MRTIRNITYNVFFELVIVLTHEWINITSWKKISSSFLFSLPAIFTVINIQKTFLFLRRRKKERRRERKYSVKLSLRVILLCKSVKEIHLVTLRPVISLQI